MTTLNLRVGDKVFVKNEADIYATLDSKGCTEGMVFMPEMRRFCGKELRVSGSAHKTCDSINNSGGLRVLGEAYHLEGMRCDGSAHGGCEAGCTYFFMAQWLTQQAPGTPSAPTPEQEQIAELVDQQTQRPNPDGDAILYNCQATNMLNATEPMPPYSVGQYFKDLSSGNHKLGNLSRILALAWFQRVLNAGVGYRFLIKGYNAFQKLRGGKPYPIYEGQIPAGERTPTTHLDLKPGEEVRILPIEELQRTLSTASFNRGMWFDPEMVKYCGNTYTVQARVNRIINEKTGAMMEMKNPCILLDDVYCRAECTPGRRGCPRKVNTYWREVWLERVNEQKVEANDNAA